VSEVKLLVVNVIVVSFLEDLDVLATRMGGSAAAVDDYDYYELTLLRIDLVTSRTCRLGCVAADEVMLEELL